MRLSLSVQVERWPIAGNFSISRGTKTEAEVVVVELSDGSHAGHGECVPYPRYGETSAGVVAAISSLRPALEGGLDRVGLQRVMPAGAARNAVDCAFWDLEAKRSGQRAHALAGLPPPQPLTTAYTISLDSPEQMARAAQAAKYRALLKVKLGGEGDPARIAAVRRAAPDAVLIVDANEGWNAANLAANVAACRGADVTLIEQPLPADDDAALAAAPHDIPICADESAHDRASLARLCDRYDAVNIKLDKTGGLTEALALADEAERLGLVRMVGCMVATSLSIAPAILVGQRAQLVDLDGPLLLARDRAHGVRYTDSLVHPSDPTLWG